MKSEADIAPSGSSRLQKRIETWFLALFCFVLGSAFCGFLFAAPLCLIGSLFGGVEPASFTWEPWRRWLSIWAFLFKANCSVELTMFAYWLLVPLIDHQSWRYHSPVLVLYASAMSWLSMLLDKWHKVDSIFLPEWGHEIRWRFIAASLVCGGTLIAAPGVYIYSLLSTFHKALNGTGFLDPSAFLNALIDPFTLWMKSGLILAGTGGVLELIIALLRRLDIEYRRKRIVIPQRGRIAAFYYYLAIAVPRKFTSGRYGEADDSPV